MTYEAPAKGVAWSSKVSRWIPPAAGLVIILSIHRAVPHAPWSSTAIYIAFSTMILLSLAGSAKGRKFDHLDPAKGRVIAIVPAFNEDENLLYACIESLLKNRRLDHIYVVDDGSDIPPRPSWNEVTGGEDNLFPAAILDVTWLRKENGGKRSAQQFALEAERKNNPKFVLTVDSDSCVNETAVVECLRAFSDPRVQGVSGVIVCRSRRGLVSRLLDMELATWCHVSRTAQSVLGVVMPCSGAMAMYRAEVIYDNLDDYMSGDVAGDDTRLTHYARLRGQVTGVEKAYASSDMPNTVKRAFNQRSRWFTSRWMYSVWELKYMPTMTVMLRTWSAMAYLLTPILVVGVLATMLHGGGESRRVALLIIPAILCLSYVETLVYPLRHPTAPRVERWLTWLLVTPVLIPWGYLMVRPAMLHAGFRYRRGHKKWGKR